MTTPNSPVRRAEPVLASSSKNMMTRMTRMTNLSRTMALKEMTTMMRVARMTKMAMMTIMTTTVKMRIWSMKTSTRMSLRLSRRRPLKLT